MRTKAFNKSTPQSYLLSAVVLLLLFVCHFGTSFLGGVLDGLKSTGLIFLLSLSSLFLWDVYYRNNGLPRSNSLHLLYYPLVLPLFLGPSPQLTSLLLINLWLWMNFRHHAAFWRQNISADQRLVQNLFDLGLLMAVITMVEAHYIWLLVVFVPQLLYIKLKTKKHYFVPFIPLLALVAISYTAHAFDVFSLPLYTPTATFLSKTFSMELLASLPGLAGAALLFMGGLILIFSKGTSKRETNLVRTNVLFCLVALFFVVALQKAEEAVLLALPVSLFIAQWQERVFKIRGTLVILLLLVLANIALSPWMTLLKTHLSL